MAEGEEGGKSGRMSIEVDGKPVPLSAEGIKKAQGNGDVGKKIGEAISAALGLNETE
jgi:hypothetical protein